MLDIVVGLRLGFDSLALKTLRIGCDSSHKFQVSEKGKHTQQMIPFRK